MPLSGALGDLEPLDSVNLNLQSTSCVVYIDTAVNQVRGPAHGSLDPRPSLQNEKL